MDPAGELAQLGDRLLDLVLRARQHGRLPASPSRRREAEHDGERDESLLGSVVELRSMRRRSASVAATSRARDARTSASCARTSAARRSFSSTSPAVARTDSTSAGSSSSAGS